MDKNFPCDICGSDTPLVIPVAEKYTGGQQLHTCGNCGFVYVRTRRSSQEIAKSWSDDIFQKGYTARIPYVFARQSYVAEWVHEKLNLTDKSICDIGAGEGQFLEICRNITKDISVFGIEPSAYNCSLLKQAEIPFFQGTIEEYTEQAGSEKKFDLITIMWTLENCLDCNKMIEAAWEMLKPGGHVMVATGSRILVPFKKPLSKYLSKNPADTHSFRFSANALKNLLSKHGFDQIALNRYQDGEFLVGVGQKAEKQSNFTLTKDNPQTVLEFFNRWDVETQWLESAVPAEV